MKEHSLSSPLPSTLFDQAAEGKTHGGLKPDGRSFPIKTQTFSSRVLFCHLIQVIIEDVEVELKSGSSVQQDSSSQCNYGFVWSHI